MGQERCERRRTALERGRCGRRRTVLQRGGVGGGAQQWDGGGGVQEGEVLGRPDPDIGGAYHGGPLSSTIDSQAPASSEQQVERPTLFVAHSTSISKRHALFAWSGLVRLIRSGSNILIGDSDASIHCTGDYPLLYNKKSLVTERRGR